MKLDQLQTLCQYKRKPEYHVHVQGKVIDVAQKKIGHENRDNQIRNHANGWIFARDNISPPMTLVLCPQRL